MRSLRHPLALCLTALALAGAPAGAEEQLVDGIAAQVGNRIVLVSEVMRMTGPQEAAMRQAGAPEAEIARMRAAALEELIEARLIEELVRQAELYVSDEEIDQTIASIAEENGLTLEQLRANVVFHGMSFEEYRTQIKRDMERRNVVNAVVGSKVSVEESETRQLYEQRFANQPAGGVAVRVRQLLVTYGEKPRPDRATACARVEAGLQRIRAGEDFGEVAREMSEVAPKDGGDIGWLHLDNVASWMRDALAPLEPGVTSDLLVLPFGCTLLNLVDRREVAPVTYEQARERLSQELWEMKLAEAYHEWIEALREKTYIERRGYFASAGGFATPAVPDESGAP
jgi:peptidyl-prolyl cis-trans isomerase SurA